MTSFSVINIPVRGVTPGEMGISGAESPKLKNWSLSGMICEGSGLVNTSQKTVLSISLLDPGIKSPLSLVKGPTTLFVVHTQAHSLLEKLDFFCPNCRCCNPHVENLGNINSAIFHHKFCRFLENCMLQILVTRSLGSYRPFLLAPVEDI